MKVRLQLFAQARQLAGSGQVEIELAEGATVADLRQAWAAAQPALAGMARQCLFAIDADYANDATTIPPGAEVAAIPPVSGG